MRPKPRFPIRAAILMILLASAPTAVLAHEHHDNAGTHNDHAATQNDHPAAHNDAAATRDGPAATRDDHAATRDDHAAVRSHPAAARNDPAATRNDPPTAARKDLAATRKAAVPPVVNLPKKLDPLGVKRTRNQQGTNQGGTTSNLPDPCTPPAVHDYSNCVSTP